MTIETAALSLDNPFFHTYALAADVSRANTSNARGAHFVVYVTGRIHDIRATCWRI